MVLISGRNVLSQKCNFLKRKCDGKVFVQPSLLSLFLRSYLEDGLSQCPWWCKREDIKTAGKRKFYWKFYGRFVALIALSENFGPVFFFFSVMFFDLSANLVSSLPCGEPLYSSQCSIREGCNQLRIHGVKKEHLQKNLYWFAWAKD